MQQVLDVSVLIVLPYFILIPTEAEKMGGGETVQFIAEKVGLLFLFSCIVKHFCQFFHILYIFLSYFLFYISV